MGGPGSGRGGLPTATIRQAERLIAERLPTVVIARRLGIGERTVRVIKSGTHFTQLRRDEVMNPRCQGCGGLLEQHPCVLCAMRRAGL